MLPTVQKSHDKYVEKYTIEILSQIVFLFLINVFTCMYLQSEHEKIRFLTYM